MSEHPITPPPEVVQQWRNAAPPLGPNREHWIATQAARWGADQELEACCEWVRSSDFIGLDGHDALRAIRRPKPSSLAEQALKALDEMEGPFGSTTLDGCALTLRAALKQLQELEGNG